MSKDIETVVFGGSVNNLRTINWYLQKINEAVENNNVRALYLLVDNLRDEIYSEFKEELVIRYRKK